MLWSQDVSQQDDQVCLWWRKFFFGSELKPSIPLYKVLPSINRSIEPLLQSVNSSLSAERGGWLETDRETTYCSARWTHLIWVSGSRQRTHERSPVFTNWLSSCWCCCVLLICAAFRRWEGEETGWEEVGGPNAWFEIVASPGIKQHTSYLLKSSSSLHGRKAGRL